MSLLTSFTRPGSVDTYDFAETVPAVLVPSGAAIAANSGVGGLIPRRMTPLTIAVIRFYVGTSSGNVDVAVMRFDGTNYTLLTSSGSTACGTGSAVQAITLGTPYVQQPGEQLSLWLAADNATATFGRAIGLGAVNAIGGRMQQKSTVFPIAGAAPFTSGLSGTTVGVWLRGSAA